AVDIGQAKPVGHCLVHDRGEGAADALTDEPAHEARAHRPGQDRVRGHPPMNCWIVWYSSSFSPSRFCSKNSPARVRKALTSTSPLSSAASPERLSSPAPASSSSPRPGPCDTASSATSCSAFCCSSESSSQTGPTMMRLELSWCPDMLM